MGIDLGLRLGTVVLKVSEKYAIPYILLQGLIYIYIYICLSVCFGFRFWKIDLVLDYQSPRLQFIAGFWRAHRDRRQLLWVSANVSIP